MNPARGFKPTLQFMKHKINIDGNRCFRKRMGDEIWYVQIIYLCA